MTGKTLWPMNGRASTWLENSTVEPTGLSRSTESAGTASRGAAAAVACAASMAPGRS